MVPHPNTIVTFAALHREDLLATTARERRAAGIPGPALQWRTLAIHVASVVAVFLGVRS